jgi:cyclophilin family peptidyl-prolyl cis-trans isomerase
MKKNVAGVSRVLAWGPWLVALVLLASCRSALHHPDSPAASIRAPETYRVHLDTSKGPVVIEVVRRWAPHGADRFHNLVRLRYFDGARFFRVVAGRFVQFGIHGEPRVSAVWRRASIPDDPPMERNRRGSIAFAFAVAHGRTTQVFINLTDNSERLDAQGFAPFGRVVDGMEVIDALNAEYGETSGGGIRAGQQGPLFAEGEAYLARAFPRLDFIRRAWLDPRP